MSRWRRWNFDSKFLAHNFGKVRQRLNVTGQVTGHRSTDLFVGVDLQIKGLVIIGLVKSIWATAHLTAGGCLAHDNSWQEFAVY